MLSSEMSLSDSYFGKKGAPCKFLLLLVFILSLLTCFFSIQWGLPFPVGDYILRWCQGHTATDTPFRGRRKWTLDREDRLPWVGWRNLLHEAPLSPLASWIRELKTRWQLDNWGDRQMESVVLLWQKMLILSSLFLSHIYDTYVSTYTLASVCWLMS